MGFSKRPDKQNAFQEVRLDRVCGGAAGRSLQGQDRGHRGRDRPEPRPHRRTLLGGAEAGVPHQEPPPHSAQGQVPVLRASRVVSKAWKSEASSWAKRMEAAKKRGALNDFDRFKLMKAKSARNKILNKAVNVQKRKLSKAGKL